jgi:hypothetical protein
MSSLQRWVKGKGHLCASEPPGIAVEFTYVEFPSGTLRGIEGQIFCDDFNTMYEWFHKRGMLTLETESFSLHLYLSDENWHFKATGGPIKK